MAANIRKFLCRCIISKCFERTVSDNFCGRWLRFNSTSVSRYNGEKKIRDRPQKRKILRQMKAEILEKNISNPEMEKSARSRKLLIPLNDVRKEWMSKHYPDQVQTMASYYGVFDHMLEGKCFRPSVVMDVNYNKDEVHYGNFLQPEKATCEPDVSFQPVDDSLTTLLMLNLDGNIFSKDIEVLHWMVGNIPNGEIKQGEVVSQYTPPCPMKGTGYHRFVFCLLSQNDYLNYETMSAELFSRCLSRRSFKTSSFVEDYDLDPIGLSFFQASWDESVSNTFTEILGMREPLYEKATFLTPNQKKRLWVAERFANKYTNM